MIELLKKRFFDNLHRHENVSWDMVEKRLMSRTDTMEIIKRMEETGGEPDVIGIDEAGAFIFCDCSKESPSERRSLCYDRDALLKRKKNKPESDAETVAKEIGVNLLDEQMYRYLQSLEEFDLKTSSWIYTPNELRALGGALFCDRRFNRVFTYHNGADSYYGARGFRGFVKL